MSQDFFDTTEKQSKEFFGDPGVMPTKPGKNLTEVLSDYYSIALGKDKEQIERELDTNLYPLLREEASKRADQNTGDAAAGKLNSVLDSATEEDIQQIREMYSFGGYIAPDAAAILAEDTDKSAVQRRVIERVIASERLIESKLGEASEGLPSAIGYWADSAVSSAVHAMVGIPARAIGLGGETFEAQPHMVDLAQEAAQLLLRDISPEYFEERMGDILDRLADAGMFSETNPMYLIDFVQLVKEYGVGMDAAALGAFDAIDVLGLSALRGIGQTTRTPKTLARIGKRDDAKNVTVQAAESGTRGEMVAENTSPSLSTPSNPDPDFFSGPELSTLRDLEANNSALNAIKKYSWGDLVQPEILAAKHDKIVKDTKVALKGYGRHEINYDVRVGSTGNIYGVGVLGKRGGEPYSKIENAQKLADKVGGEVKEQVVDGTTKYVVVKEIDVPTDKMVDPTDLYDVATSLLSTIMSTTARTTKELDAMLKRGEAQTVRTLKDLGKSYKTARSKVKGKELDNVNNLIRRLRDDPLENWRTEPVSMEEFSDLYMTKYGAEPRQEVLDYYKTLRDISDVDYYVNADLLLKEAINNKETMVRLDGAYYRAKKVTDIEPDHPVWDTSTNRLKLWSDMDPTRAVAYEIKDFAYNPGGHGQVRYVVGSTFDTRRLYHTDVLGYRIGGHRKYTDPWEFYIKQEGSIKIAGGAEYSKKPTAFMAVRLQDEAETAVEQFNNIATAIGKGLPDRDINRVILANNDWNLSIENVRDFKQFADEHGLDPQAKVNYGGDNEPLVGSSWAGEDTVGSKFRSGLSASKRRGSRPLLGFGGEVLETLDPSAAIERGFAQTVAKRGDMTYLHNAVNGWLKAASKAGAIQNAEEIAGMSAKNKMLNAKVSRFTNEGKALDKERRTIMFRMSGTTPAIQRETKLMRAAANYVYGTAGKGKLAKATDWVSTKDPAGFFRSIAFHSKLGLFAVEQVYVQASQLINAAGIAAASIGTIGAVRGMLAVMPLRLALIEQIPDGALKRLAATQAPFTGISPDDFIQLRDWIKHTGRNVVNRTAIEENNPAGSLMQSKVLDYGQTFFNEGELIARLGAASMNLIERRMKFPDEDIFSNAVTNQMIHRQDVLSASMTSASSARWQRSLLAVPLQFTTYHVRMAEQIFTDRILTPAERRRLALTHMMVYGAAGVPAAGWLQDRMGYTGAIDPSSGLYDVVRYGALDAILTGISGEETALSSRLAVGEGLFDLFQKMGTDAIWEVAMGPGGTISYDFGYAMKKMVENVFAGRFDHLQYDWNRFARNVTAYDRAFTYWMGQRYGIYVSRKTEQEMIGDMSSVDTLLKTMGIPLAEQDALWTSISNRNLDKKMLNKVVKEVKRLDAISSRLLEDGDIEGAARFMDDIGAILEVLTPGEKDEVLLRLRQTLTLHENVVKGLIKTGHTEMANKLKELTK